MNFPGLHFNTIIKAYLTIVNVLFTSEVGNRDKLTTMSIHSSQTNSLWIGRDGYFSSF